MLTSSCAVQGTLKIKGMEKASVVFHGVGVCLRGLLWFPKSAGFHQALSSGVREDLLAPSVIATVQASARDAVKALTSESDGGDDSPVRQAALRAEIARLVDAIAQVGMSDALRDRLQSAEKELARITAVVAPRREFNAERIAQQAVAAYKRRLLDLASALQDEGMDRERTRALLSDILGPVVLRRARACNVRRKLIRARGP